MKWKQYGIGFLVLMAVCLSGFGQTAYAAEDSQDVIVDGVTIGGLDVSGMTEEEARQTVEEYFDRFRNGTLRLSFNGTIGEIGFDELGISWDNPEVVAEAAKCGQNGNVLERYKILTQLKTEKKEYPIEYSVDRSKVENYLLEKAEELKVEPVDATITKEKGKPNFEITQSVTGLTINVSETLNHVMDSVDHEWEGGVLSLDADVEITEPKYKTEELELITDCLGEHQTNFNPSVAGRSQNLVNGTHFIDGVVLMPGETLSLYDYLYPCTEENGYKSGIAYADGGYVDAIGGGICQISTTLYNALLKSELNVLTRSPHSMTVSYAEPGFDSAESAGSKDLSFENSTDYPVYVEAWVQKDRVYTGLWGKDDRPDNRVVKYYNNILSRVGPGEPIYTEDPNLPEGEIHYDQPAYDAVKAELYKQVIIDGQVVETTLLHTDRYRASPAKIRVGTGAPVEEVPVEEAPVEGQENPEG
ncbi:MAG: vanomycin resistance protein VanB [Lachnospiraceae bacterium]|jgi:vancomycin resistance protein YoaR|nr:vanomycin resistance protein VanB [Lachnospiraceae bacterium]